ncbi:MAG: ATP-binding protein [Reyranella sp.]|uniref:ATP-binding protein n=1 Tax=Reyranella sp. TaxID=1929291 RepID=UPI003D11F071
MNTPAEDRTSLPARYERALLAYAGSDADEAALMAAFELGRTILDEQHGLVDLLAMHQAALTSLLEGSFDVVDIRRRLIKANEFLTQAAAPLEMAHLGWFEMIGRLRRANEELERRVAERTAAHREAEERLNRAQHIAGIGSWELDLKTGRHFWSKEMYRICGLADEGHAPSSGGIADHVHGDDRAGYDAWLAQLAAGSDPGTIECRIQHPDGSSRIVSVEGEASRAPDEVVTKISCTAQDVTDSKRAEADLRDLQEELAHVARLNTIGHMASALAHELNQPLTAIANFLSGSQRLLSGKSDETSQHVRYAVGKASEQALRASHIVRRLRGFMERRETEFRTERITKLVEDSAALALLGARDAGVLVTVTLDPGIDLVMVDKVQVQQVLANLLRNAMEAMQASDRKELVISTAPADEDLVLVTVADSGPGIAEEIAARLFQPFVTTKQQGMGVGLSICRTIIESHGGKIWLEPNPGGGAIFLFTLRRATSDDIDGTAT